MNKAAIQDLYAYTSWAWRRIIDSAGPGDEILSRAAPGSGWPALRNCLGHIILAYDRWNPAIIDLRSQPLPDLAGDALRTWDDIESQRERVRAPLKMAIDAWSEDDLALMHDADIDGSSMRYSRAELITHLLLHERGHHGDVTTLFWQLGLEVPMLEYRFHLARHGKYD